MSEHVDVLVIGSGAGGRHRDADGSSFSPKQNYCVGGNTKFYGAILYRFRERDFGPVQHVDGVSPAWPISYADLAPSYDRAERLYLVHGSRGEDPDDPPAAGPYPWLAISDEPAHRPAARRPDRRRPAPVLAAAPVSRVSSARAAAGRGTRSRPR